MNSFVDKLKYRYNTGTIIDKLIYLNVGLFLVTLLTNIAYGLFKNPNSFILNWFALDDTVNELFTKPWAIISYGFLHSGFIHLLFNMFALYYIGNLFVQYFTQKQALTFYILGTIFGGFFFLIAHNYFPLFENTNARLVGASAGVSAIFIGLATYMPNYQINIRFIGFVKLWHIAAVWLAFDVLGLIGPNAGGSFSHLGGSLFGFLYVTQASNKKIAIFDGFFGIFKKNNLKTVHKSAPKKRYKNTSSNQQKIDAILDKIGKSGYDTLTKEEKEFLFKQGKQ